MKKLLIAVLLSALFVLGIAMTVTADNGPHGGFTANTDACANCHRAHTAKFGSNGLLIMNPTLLCESCHADGLGAGTDVVNGVYSQAGSDVHYVTNLGGAQAVEGTDGASLFGGGFEFAVMATDWSDPAAAGPRATTSTHALEDATAIVWGAGRAAGNAATYTMECTSCHDPHGKAGQSLVAGVATPTESYRLLRWQPQGSSGYEPPASNVNWNGGAFPNIGGSTGWLVVDLFPTPGTEWYTIGTNNAFSTGDYMAGETADVYNQTAIGGPNYVQSIIGTSYFCAQCHDRYLANSSLRNAGDVSVLCGTIDAAGNVAGSLHIRVNSSRPSNLLYTDQLGNTTQYPIDVYLPVVAPDVNGKHPTYPDQCVPGTRTQNLSADVVVGGVTVLLADVAATGTWDVWFDNRPSGDPDYMFMHSSGDLRPSMDLVAGPSTRDNYTGPGRACLSCHVSHGSAAVMSPVASGATLHPDEGAVGDNSTLLRMDNRSMCLRCHDGMGGGPTNAVNWP